jgi:dethiobiotin synthetase
MPDLFVTGTDTDVGKTWVTAAIATALRRRGEDVAALKVVASGVAAGAGADADRLGVAAGHPPRCGATLKAALSPHRAAALEGRELSRDDILRWVRRNSGTWTLAEGAGGWEVPLGPDWRISDLAADLGWPVLIVAANRLGVLNHTLLTVAAIRARNLRVAGVVLNGHEGASAAYNREDLAALLPDVPVVAVAWSEDPVVAGGRVLEAIA